ncbi:MAG TPA: hypothetical protein VH834_25025 [Solirubrobacteraceae bacterium]
MTQIAVPADARALGTLARIDYADAFLVAVDSAQKRTGEQWARAALEAAPDEMRRTLQRGWAALGLKLGMAPRDRSVLGWPIRRSAPEFVLLGTDSRIGMPAQLLFQRRPDALLFATFVQQDNAIARAAWGRVERVHVPIVRRLLERLD